VAVLVRTALALTIAVTAAPARGAPPLCFPERTVLQVARLQDDQGRALGGVRAGQVVRVLEDRVGKKAASALVEVDAPIPVRGYVPRDTLRVFLRREVAVEPDLLWWLAGSPFELRGLTGSRIRLRWRGPHGEDTRAPLPRLTCEDVVGRPPHGVYADWCHGASAKTLVDESGQRAHFRREQTVLRTRSPRITVSGADDIGIVAERGRRVLVEVVQTSRFAERLRVRAWASRDQVVLGPSPSGQGSTHLCCEGSLDAEVGRRGAVLAGDVDLHVDPYSAPFVRAPKGLRFRVLGEPCEGMRRIAFRFPRWDLDEFQFALEAWAPVASLPAVTTGDDDAAAVIGRLSVKGAPSPADFSRYEVTASPDRERPRSVLADRDGRFLLPVGTSGSVRLDARSADGRLAGSVDNLTALPGGEEEEQVVLGPAAHLEGRVRNRAGAWLPNVAVVALAKGAFEPSVRTVSDDRGKFRFALSPGKYGIRADDPGMQWSHYVHASAPGSGVVVELWRRRVILGAVPTVGGECTATEVEVETNPSSPRLPDFRRRYPVSSDCTFAATDIGRAWNPVDVTAFVGPTRISVTISDRSREYHEGLWDEDPEPICMGGSCAPGWQRSGVHASVVDGDNVLVAERTVVEVALSNGHKQTCETTAGTCFVQGLPPSGRATVRVQRVGGPSTAIELKGRVHDALLRLP
jgi:hypothetical protein